MGQKVVYFILLASTRGVVHLLGMNRNLIRAAKISVGVLFLVLGVAGLFLPFLQGVLFLLVGLAILAPQWPWAGRLMERLRRRHPKTVAELDGAVGRVRATIRRVTARWRC